jgi:AcrR family transcriptional regulator
MFMDVTVSHDLGRRERRRQETFQRIMHAAFELFAKQGYAETAVEHITEAADIGKGTFFNYFPTKDALLLAIFDAVADRFHQLELRIPEITDVRKALTEFTHATLQEPARSPKILRGIFGAALTVPAIGERFEKTVRLARKTVVALFEHGQQIGQVRTDISAHDLGRNYQQFIFGTEMVWMLTPDQDLHEWIDTMVELFWRGSAAPGAPDLDGSKEKSL